MKPNISWMTLESVRADHTSAYGYHKNTTPFLEKILQRAEATVLDPMIAPLCGHPHQLHQCSPERIYQHINLDKMEGKSIHSRLTSIRFQNC